MQPVLIRLPRFLMRDFRDTDRQAFISYQTDPRYLRLYDLDADYAAQSDRLFDQFLRWREEQPRANYQLGIFDQRTGALCGCAGLRGCNDRVATLGIELAPAEWGRFRLALDVADALAAYAFSVLNVDTIIGSTASGNTRVEKLARRFGATIVARRQGPEWMQTRGWEEVDWALSRDCWVELRLLRPSRF